MTRTDFIQRVIARSLPALNKVEHGVRYAEKVWDELTRLGYGAAKQREPNSTKNWYQELSQYQREWFDKFWNAFNYKHGRNRGALAWIKIGEQTSAKYQQIVTAAHAESKKILKGNQSKVMAERWLTEFRFEDHITKSKGKGSAIKRTLLNNEIKALERFNSDGLQDDAIAKLKAELKSL